MKRFAAIVAAVGMIVVAVLVRGAMDDDESTGDDGDSTSVVMCATDVADACLELGSSVEVRVEEPSVTAAALADGSIADDIDAWITSTAWLEVVDSRAPASLGDARAIATSPTVMATAPDRYEAINDLCAGGDIWQCLGGAAGADWAELGDGANAEWGEMKVGMPDGDLAVGLPIIASAAAGFFGNTDFASNDLDGSDFDSWLAALTEPSGEGERDPARTLATQQGAYSAGGSTSAQSSRVQNRGVDTIGPEVPVSVTAAIVELPGSDAPGTDGVRDALEDLGWARADEGDLAPTLKPGVMAALHSLWRAVTS